MSDIQVVNFPRQSRDFSQSLHHGSVTILTVDPKLTERLNNTAGKMPRLGPDPLAAWSGPHAFCAFPTAAYAVGIIQAAASGVGQEESSACQAEQAETHQRRPPGTRPSGGELAAAKAGPTSGTCIQLCQSPHKNTTLISADGANSEAYNSRPSAIQ